VCVHVHEGDYIENIDFNGKNILVVGVDGADRTTIRGSGTGPTVTFSSNESSAAELRSFTVTDGAGVLSSTSESRECGYRDTCMTYTDTYRGGGIYVDGAGPTLNDLIVIANLLPSYSYTEISSTDDMYVYSMGGGAYVTDGTPTIVDSIFQENSADEGGGLWLDAASSPLSPMAGRGR
jgi:ribose 5-phosphate isomerase